MSEFNNFKDWKEFLNDRVDQAHKMGMDNDTISNLAYQIGDYLAEEIKPSNSENKLLRDLWESSDKEQQQSLAKIMVNYVDKN